ncbi:MAG: S1 RNA-binding domain-containing protein, partial [Filomicrobium sp.]
MSQSEMSKELNPTQDEFAALLAESLAKEDVYEGSVVTGKIVGIEKDLAIIDVGLKMEGRVPIREFSTPESEADLSV